jgi:hypothetical protein
MDAEQSARVNHHAARCWSSTDAGVSIPPGGVSLLL